MLRQKNVYNVNKDDDVPVASVRAGEARAAAAGERALVPW